MDLLVIGDVHGCYHTLRDLVENHWDPETTILIQLGDLVNKGPHSSKCIKYWLSLEEQHAGKVFLLKGNHELKYLKRLQAPSIFTHWNTNVYDLKREGLVPKTIVKWLKDKPLKWENEHVLVTHAGVGKNAAKPFVPQSRSGVLYNKQALKRLPKVQVKGHNIVEGHRPVFKPNENAWYIDTGAWSKKFLSAIHLSETGEMKNIVRVHKNVKDFAGAPSHR